MSQAGLINTTSSPVPPTVATSYLLDDGNSAVPAANVLEVLGGSGSFTSIGVPNQIKINVVNDGFPWSDQAVSFDANTQNGYFCTAALTVQLPPNVTFANPLVSGNTVIIYADTASQVVIKAAAGQQIEISQMISGVAGTATSTQAGSIVTLTYRVSDSTWHSISTNGNWLTM